MTGKEWTRFTLTMIACNGWWLYAKYPLVGAMKTFPYKPMLLLPVIPTALLVGAAVTWVVTHWNERM